MTPQDHANLWSEKYAERFAELREREERYRAEAFVELTRFVASEPLRVMTARDLHLLDGAGNAFVCGLDPAPDHLAAFIWQLHAYRPQRDGIRAAWFHGRLVGRLRRRRHDYIRAITDVRDYLDFVFFDAPRGGGEKDVRPFGGSFLTPLLGDLAAELGHCDPLSARAWGDVPLPQVFQYHKYVARRVRGKGFVDRNPSDHVLSDFAAEINRRTVGA